MLNYEGNVFFIGDFDDSAERELTVPLIREIQKQSQLKWGRIDLYINSFGGYGHLVDQFVELVELAKGNDVTVRTIIPSVAFSAGSILAVTGTPGERYIARTGNHLIHYGSALGAAESTPLQVERFSAYKKSDFKNTLLHYNKYADVPNLSEEMLDDGFFVPAAKCIKWGLADKYLDKFDIGEPTE